MDSINRIKRSMNSLSDHHLQVLFGPGVVDVFFNSRGMELSIDQALYEEFVSLGFERILFFSPHKSLYGFDQRILDSVVPIEKMGKVDTGPLNKYQAFTQTSTTSRNGNRGMIGDVHAIRIIDTLLKQSQGPRTCVVFLQAETCLRFFDDHRTLAGLIGEWATFGSQNLNTAVFIFSAENDQNLEKVAHDLPVPELRELILQKKVSRFISGPDKEEISNFLKSCQRKGVVVEDIKYLAGMMSQEAKPLKFWINSVKSQVKNGLVLNYQLANSLGWIEAVRKPGHNAMMELESLYGLENVKKRLLELVALTKIYQNRPNDAEKRLNLHMIFRGNPGTGKTTVARLFGEILHELGWLNKGHLVEVQPANLISDYVGGTSKKVNEVVDQALDGVLFIDEAYGLTEEDRGGYGIEALEVLLSRMENERDRLVVICAGYFDKMEKFRRSNPGLERRFTKDNIIDFIDFGIAELMKIIFSMINTKGYVFSKEMEHALHQIIEGIFERKGQNFGNAGEMRNLAEALERNYAVRIVEQGLPDDKCLTINDIPDAYRIYLPVLFDRNLDWRNEIESLVGLSNVKIELQKIFIRLEYEKMRYQVGLNRNGTTDLRHFVFVGNPGTGKTTIARAIAKIYYQLGLLATDHLIEVTRSDLVAGFVGQTAIKTREKIRDALNGVLFIDEAYSLSSGDGFGTEAIDELVRGLEEYRNRLVVVAAGYPEPMHQFLETNPGLSSRFGEILEFDDFSLGELWAILENLINSENFFCSEGVKEKSIRYFEWWKIKEGTMFGNGRSVRELFEKIKNNAAVRVTQLIRDSGISPSHELLSELREVDVPEPGYYFGFSPLATTNAIANERI